MIDQFFLPLANNPKTWAILWLFTIVFFVLFQVRAKSKNTNAPAKLWAFLGLSKVNADLRLGAAAIWCVLFLCFLLGIVLTLNETGKSLLSGAGESYRYYLLTLAAATAGLSAIIALPFTLVRTKNLEAQTLATAQGLVTDRLNKAVEGLGAQKEVNRLGRNITLSDGARTVFEWQDEPFEIPKDSKHNEFGNWTNIALTEPNLEVRIGSIYALERIAKDNPPYHVQVIEILCAYIRQNAPSKDLVPTENIAKRLAVRDDIQTAVSVIGRRSEEGKSAEWLQRYRLDLRRCDLSGVDFVKGDFSAAMFHYSRFETAIFAGAKLWGTEFYETLLNYVDWYDADLRGARLDNCIVNRPVLPSGVSSYGFAISKDTSGITVMAADLSAITSLGRAGTENTMFGSSDTKLSERLQLKLDETLQHLREIKGSDEDATETDLIGRNFATWSPYKKHDGATIVLLREFWRTHGLTEFPFHGDAVETV